MILLRFAGSWASGLAMPLYKRENKMKQDKLIDWLTLNCPIFVSLLNQKAKGNLPNGIINYLGTGTESEIEAGRTNFLTIESSLQELISYSCEKEV